ncbi:alpha/beta fold hydrolase [Bordetella trematum]|uniref:alpha/beta fold hydrolase n=1 Tax=Bordetella trematum TaxID=123899 RepID=UPI003AF3EE18
MKKVVLLIPGLMNPPSIWDEVRAGIDGQFEVRVADVGGQESIERMATDARAAVADVTGAEDELIICGFSMGSYVALEMLAPTDGSAPVAEPVKLAAVLVGATANVEGEQGAEQRRKTVSAIERDFDGFVEKLAPYLVAPEFQQNPEFEKMKQKMRSTGGEMAIRQNQAIATRRIDQRAWAALRCPIRLVCGSDDRINPPERSHELAGMLGNAEVVDLSGTGHMIIVEKPAAVADCINKFLTYFR